jgi:hypothetical protein
VFSGIVHRKAEEAGSHAGSGQLREKERQRL